MRRWKHLLKVYICANNLMDNHLDASKQNSNFFSHLHVSTLLIVDVDDRRDAKRRARSTGAKLIRCVQRFWWSRIARCILAYQEEATVAEMRETIEQQKARLSSNGRSERRNEPTRTRNTRRRLRASAIKTRKLSDKTHRRRRRQNACAAPRHQTRRLSARVLVDASSSATYTIKQ